MPAKHKRKVTKYKRNCNAIKNTAVGYEHQVSNT